ncbi:hypothetical protein BD309DRAFT_905399 [Dichomitus squalens]|nr:hypothetical protein BD309DRAFT_905399 [Dichomitus squalens]
MMRSIYAATVLMLLSSAVLGAPTASLDPAVFLQNGQDAQTLNAEFANLKASDRCNDGELACINNSVATCSKSNWQLVPCSGTSNSCFALPSTTEEGTVLTCTTNNTALSLISATGATGGIAVKSTNTTIDFPTDCDSDDSTSNSTESASASASAETSQTHKHSHETHSASITSAASSSTAASTDSTATGEVTITVTVVPTSTSPSETFTLDPSAASSLLSSLATDPNVSITTIFPSSVSSAAPSAKVTSTARSQSVASSSNGSTASSKVVGVTSSSSASSASLPVIVRASTITLAPLITANARAVSASTSAAVDGGYYGGYQ